MGLERVHAIGWSNGAANLILLASEHPDTIDAVISLHGMASFDAEDITARSLVITGRHDLTPPAKGEEIAAGIPDARYELFEESGHFAPVEEPEKFVAILRVRARINAHSWASRRPYGKAREVNNI